jgi:hypothetical protein
MKIDLNNLTNGELGNGQHRVKIIKVVYGVSTKNTFPYFKCRFENQDGYIYQRFHVSEGGKLIIKRLFEAAGIYGNKPNTKDLIGKEIIITVITKDRINFETGEISGTCREPVSYKHLLEEELLELTNKNYIFNNNNI